MSTGLSHTRHMPCYGWGSIQD